jgi:integrase
MPTVAQLIDSFLAHTRAAVQAGRTAANTLAHYRFTLAHLRGGTDAEGRPLADRDAATLTLPDLARLPATHHVGAAVRRLFRWAKMANPLADLRVPSTGQRTRVLEPWELRRLLRTCGFELKRIVWFLAATGARPAELRELRWGSVFERERVIRLTRFKARDRRKDGVKVRVIPLTVAAARVLAYWRRARLPGSEDFVFTNELCRPWQSSALRQAMRAATRRAGLNRGGERVVCYTLRHTFATSAVRDRMPDTLLADIMGHANLNTTRRYLHRRPEDLVAGLDAALKNRRGKAG